MEFVNGKRLWVSDIGEGRTVAFVHGLGTTSMIYQPLVEALGAGYRTIRFDLEGHGRSPLTGIPTIQTWADDLRALLEEERIERWAVEACRQLPHGGVAARAHVRDDGAHRRSDVCGSAVR